MWNKGTEKGVRSGKRMVQNMVMRCIMSVCSTSSEDKVTQFVYDLE